MKASARVRLGAGLSAGGLALPPVIGTTLLAYYEAHQETGTVDASPAQITDLSGNSRHMTGGSASKPIIRASTATPTGKKSFDCGGARWAQTAAGVWFSAQAYTMVMVIKTPSTITGYDVHASKGVDAASYMWKIYNSSNGTLNANRGDMFTDVAANTWYLFTLRANNADSNAGVLRRNRVVVDTIASVPQADAANFTMNMGADGDGSSIADGYLASLGVWDGAASDADITTLETWMNTRFGVG